MFDNDYDNQSISKSFFTLDIQDHDGLHDWLVGVKTHLQAHESSSRVLQRKFLRAYLGKSYTHSGITDVIALGEFRRRKEPIKIPHIHDITEVKVAQMTQLKSDIEILPRHNEYADRAAAKISKYVVRNIFEKEQFDAKMIEIQRAKIIAGEAFAYVVWDEDAGDILPAWQAAVDHNMDKITLGDEEHKYTVKIDRNKPLMTGDVRIKVLHASEVLLQLKTDYEKCDYCMVVDYVPTDELVADNPDKADLLDSRDDANEMHELLALFNPVTGDTKAVENQTAVYTFYHRKTKHLPNGNKTVFTDTCVLSTGDIGTGDGQLPIVRITDIDLPSKMRGVSKYIYAVPVQNRYDHLNNQIAKNIFLTGQAKWIAQKNSVRKEDLGNISNLVEYNVGSNPPVMASITPNPNEVYQYVQQMRENLDRIMGSHGISRGELPRGVTAASALQYLNELESNRASSDIAKHGKFVKDVAKKVLSEAAYRYDNDDGRMVKIVGEENKYDIEYFDAADLSKPYDVRFENSSGFPETRAAQEQRLLEMIQRKPDLFSPQRWEELLMGSNIIKAKSLATVAIRSADSENEDILNNRPVSAPEDFEDHIAHLRSHYKAIQARSFKEKVNTEAYVRMKQHIMETEQLAQAKSQVNPLFGAELARLPLFPMFIQTQAPASREQLTQEVAGATSTGQPAPSQIPATPVDEGDSRVPSNRGPSKGEKK